jgi:hypothetical protein
MKESLGSEVSGSIDRDLVEKLLLHKAGITKEFIEESLGGLPEEVIIATLKEKFPENFL